MSAQTSGSDYHSCTERYLIEQGPLIKLNVDEVNDRRWCGVASVEQHAIGTCPEVERHRGLGAARILRANDDWIYNLCFMQGCSTDEKILTTNQIEEKVAVAGEARGLPSGASDEDQSQNRESNK